MSPPSPPRALVVFDMDRTLSAGRVIQAVGEGLGLWDQVQAIIARRDAGSLSQDEVTLRIARLLEGVRLDDFDRLAQGIPLSPGGEEAVRALLDEGLQVAICSDSYARAVAPLAERLGLSLWAANVLEERGPALTGLLLPWGPPLGLGPTKQIMDKREALPLLARKAGVPLARTVHIGDGDHDALAFPLVGLGIAYDGTPKARAAAHHSLEGSLAPVPRLVLDWLKGPGQGADA